MKLIIQISCYNEEKTIGITLNSLPRHVPGFDIVEWLIVDDGSNDKTARVAIENGIDHVVRHTRNQGLASSFMTGIQKCLELGADVIVNTDADNQYNSGDIPLLTTPIIEKKADIVIGERPIDSIQHFSFIKKSLQKLGSYVVRAFSQTEIPDAPSGFRALSRDAAMKIVVFSNYTYTLETIIQAGQKNMAITSVPVSVNEELRPSRLVSSVFGYVWRSIATIIRIFVIYRPFRFFGSIGLFLFCIGFLVGLRFIYFFVTGDGQGHIQSVILAAVFIGIGFQTILVAFVADLLAANRKLLEDIRYSIKYKSLNRTDKSPKGFENA